MRLRTSSQVLTFVLFLFSIEVEAALPLAEKSPNVIMILADDLGYGDLSCYGHARFKTPRLDRMADEGVRMNRFHTPSPFCAPTRASLLTGRYPLRCGMDLNPTPDAGPKANALALPQTEILLSELFRKAGYRTSLIGKWHLGHQRPEMQPTARGFDEYLGILYSNDMRPVQLLQGTEVIEAPVQQASLTERYTKAAIEFIERNHQQPFFLYLAHAMPHKPLAVSPAFAGASGAGLYGDVLAELDASVGQVLDALKRLGIEHQTLVVFSSDNGAWYGGSSGGLRGMKSTTWCGGHQVPLIARWPGRIAPRKLPVEGLGVTSDLFPTLLNVVGIERPADRVYDGVDLMPLWQGEREEVREFVYGQIGEQLATIRDKRWKFHLVKPNVRNPKEPWVDPRAPDGTTIIAPTEQYGPSSYPGLLTGDLDAPLLFDLEHDPGEQANVAGRHPEIVARLRKELERFRASAGTRLISVKKIWHQGEHNAFTDLIRWRDHWYCSFREAQGHVGGDGKLRVLSSVDGEDWESSALLEEPGIDLRDPKLSITPDDRLMIVAGGSVYRGKTLLGRQPRVAFSENGREWTATQRILSEGDWLWRVTWQGGKAYGISYDASKRTTDAATKAAQTGEVEPGDADWKLRLLVSDDGIDYQQIKQLDVPGHPNETTLRFLPSGDLVAMVRREGGNRLGWIGRSAPPFTDWQWQETKHRLGGPNFIDVGRGRLLAGSRNYPDKTKFSLYHLTAEGEYDPILDFPSGGDCSYPGLVFQDGLLWVSYYSSHEGKSAIYLAKVRLAK